MFIDQRMSASNKEATAALQRIRSEPRPEKNDCESSILKAHEAMRGKVRQPGQARQHES